MVHGYHVIFTAYGFWLPNDPRGSWSDFVGSWELLHFGRATKTDERKSLAHRPHDRAQRLAAKEALKYPPVRFTGIQARAVGHGFAKSVQRGGLTVWACSILPEHVHMVIARLGYPVERTVNLLKGSATGALLDEGLHPFGDHRRPSGKVPHCWARGQWKVFLDTVEDIGRAITYVENNPLKEGKPRQHWRFVTPFTGV